MDTIRDLDEALRITGGSRELADELYQQFIDELPAQMAQIEALCAEGANGLLREMLHQVKGGAAVCAVKPFIEALDNLHQDVKIRAEADQVRNSLAVLRRRAGELLGP
jgi:HPt (histidine-containing phosphotransfer) domain-containing protein